MTTKDIDVADVVVSLGCDINRLPAAPRNLQKWDEVPAPDENFTAADEAELRTGTLVHVEI